MTSTELKKRAIALAEKTKIDSVTPDEVGQLSNDIVEYIENVEINGSSLGIRKTYTSVSAMEADSTAPKDDKGVLLRRGMLVNIYNQSDPDSADNGKVFSFQNPGWAFRGTVDAGYATKNELEEVEDYAKKATAEYNVSVFHPTSGTSGTNRYDLAGAIGKVPAELRTAGLKVSFLNSAGKPESKSVLIHFDTSSYDANSYGNQKNNIPQITSTLDNVVITVKQPDNQCRVVAKFLSAQLTSIFGSLNGQKILWIGTSIPNGNTNGFATGEKYPELIQEITGCVMENASYQGTCLRRYMPQFIGDDSEAKPVMTNSWNYNTSEGNSKFLSLEGILKKINTIDSPDIIVFDHGINDEYDSKEWILYTWDNIYRED